MNDLNKNFKLIIESLSTESKTQILFNIFKTQDEASKKALIEYASMFIGKKND